VNRGLNISQLNKGQIPHIKVGLSKLFKSEINPMITNIITEKDDSDGWLAFEGADDESMDGIKQHIVQAIGRNSQRLYGERE
jgi:hypothetical protein